MVLFFIVLVLAVVLGTVALTAILGRFWRLVLVRPAHRADGATMQRLTLRSPGPADYEAQQAMRARLDRPFAVVFLALSLIVLATPAFAQGWVPLLALWLVAAAVRWMDSGPAASFVRLGMAILLVVVGLIILGLRGGDALVQAGVYIALALVGFGILARTGGFSLSLGPADPNGRNLPPRRRATKGGGYAMLDTLPAAQSRTESKTAAFSARRNPQRVPQDESGVLSSPYYPQPSGQYGD